jgi:hypothetical protein
MYLAFCCGLDANGNSLVRIPTGCGLHYSGSFLGEVFWCGNSLSPDTSPGINTIIYEVLCVCVCIYIYIYIYIFKNTYTLYLYTVIILPVVLYGCETWSLILKEECRLRVFENMVLRRIFGPKRDEVIGE